MGRLTVIAIGGNSLLDPSLPLGMENQVAVTPELRAKILEMNPRDQALYEHFKSLLVARRDRWRTMKQEASLARIAEREARREARRASAGMATADNNQ